MITEYLPVIIEKWLFVLQAVFSSIFNDMKYLTYSIIADTIYAHLRDGRDSVKRAGIRYFV